MKKLFLTFALSAPVIALAHVKWFAEQDHYVPPYNLYDGPVLAWVAGALFLVLIGVYLEYKLKVPIKLEERLGGWMSAAVSLASIGFGTALIIFSLSGFVFAPNMPRGDSMLLVFQGIAGTMILLGIFERIGALLLLITFTLAIREYGIVEMMDTLEMVGFALYVLILGRPKWKIVSLPYADRFLEKFKSYAVPVLRVCTGINLMILGFSEKILTPSLTDNFLTHYHWNFMQGFGMSNYWFAFSAGMVEFLFGLFLILGLITRTTTLVLALFLITTLILLGPTELVGHLPHFSIAIVLLVVGSGKRLKLRV
jgi:uncharacterized membrane protein YphA (DoxX/SURF4 family)